LLSECWQAGHHSLAGEIRVSLAEAQFLAGHMEAAAALVCQALSEAERLQQPRPLLALQQRQGAWLERIVPQLSDPQWCQQHIGTAPALPADEVCESLLSKREAAVLRLIAQGCSNQQIAEQLYISLHTVKTHARRINVKLGVERRTQAVARAKALGWME
jgi:ATP/maltotriose-dependent transcriptional regulator MalT